MSKELTLNNWVGLLACPNHQEMAREGRWEELRKEMEHET